ncbi:MAPEG family protein [Aquabacter cavernae]|uniref:MAPEG family protein n=1 Tax=Aquabacter cavernae TaxID=2496029 RepID=UPI000F8E4787|nr:MAPEG family protein [Aquabacter cavernae]
MTVELVYLALSIVLAFIQLLLPIGIATRARGLAWNAGPRDVPMPPLDGLGGRLERAHRNMMETFPLFVGAVAVAHFAGAHNWLSMGGAALYFWARLAYVPLYAFGVPYVRSLVWTVAMAGMFLVLLSPLV